MLLIIHSIQPKPKTAPNATTLKTKVKSKINKSATQSSDSATEANINSNGKRNASPIPASTSKVGSAAPPSSKRPCLEQKVNAKPIPEPKPVVDGIAHDASTFVKKEFSAELESIAFKQPSPQSSVSSSLSVNKLSQQQQPQRPLSLTKLRSVTPNDTKNSSNINITPKLNRPPHSRKSTISDVLAPSSERHSKDNESDLFDSGNRLSSFRNSPNPPDVRHPSTHSANSGEASSSYNSRSLQQLGHYSHDQHGKSRTYGTQKDVEEYSRALQARLYPKVEEPGLMLPSDNKQKHIKSSRRNYSDDDLLNDDHRRTDYSRNDDDLMNYNRDYNDTRSSSSRHTSNSNSLLQRVGKPPVSNPPIASTASTPTSPGSPSFSLIGNRYGTKSTSLTDPNYQCS
ncbi:unnamed protein product [Ambrosiozyma monospora]|uniref:Unnamed protein product n=1 Tax=Ambrosiozyma monospora TaxID=43982 RepID=A0A9W7DJT2_AMBMO|nr:unnamed protein product [Ambrosiozyma monospora]